MRSQLLEIWENLKDPTARILFDDHGRLPANFVPAEWRYLGESAVAEDVAAEVGETGFVMMKSNVLFDPGTKLGSAPRSPLRDLEEGS